MMKICENSALASSPGRLLIVDDETELVTALCETLAEQDYETMGFGTGQEALDALKAQSFDVILADLVMPEMDGIRLMQAALEIDPNLVAIIMTGHGAIQTAVESMKAGAFDYVLKPFKLTRMLPVLSRAMEVRRLRVENVQLREMIGIYELSVAAAFTLDRNTILNKMADAVMQGLKADELSIMLPTSNAKELSVAIVRGHNRDHILGYRMPMDQGIAGWVVHHKQPLTLQGEVNDPRFAPVRPRSDICTSVLMPMLAGGKVEGMLTANAIHRRPFTPGEVKAMNILAGIAASALKGVKLYEQVKQAGEKIKESLEKQRQAMLGIIQAMALTVERRDPYTAGHQRRVAALANAIASEMGFSENQTDGIRLAGMIHDLGKIAIPIEILSKPGAITENEFGIIKSHPEAGYDILKEIEFPWPIARMVLQHHERMDGSGYPRRISNDDILEGARVLAVADVVEAMSSDRPYRPALGVDKALDEIKRNRGVRYDSGAVDACVRLFTTKDFNLLNAIKKENLYVPET